MIATLYRFKIWKKHQIPLDFCQNQTKMRTQIIGTYIDVRLKIVDKMKFNQVEKLLFEENGAAIDMQSGAFFE